MPHNGLSDDEAERLAWLAEEAGEVVQAIGKVLRHGYDSCHPNDQHQVTNRELLEGELGDLRAAIVLMTGAGDIVSANIFEAASNKIKKVGRYLFHNRLNGGPMPKHGTEQ